MTEPILPLSRRGFVQSLAALVPAALSTPAPAAATPLPAAELDAALLDALAEAVLPSELGPQGARAAAAAFAEWVAGFEPVAEVNHGYGTGELEFTGADPAPGWAAQLRALELAARRLDGVGFTALPVERRRELVRQQLARAGADRLPPVAEAGHVALGLLSHWYASPEALDRCHGARIGRHGCRPLEHSSRRPEPLEGA